MRYMTSDEAESLQGMQIQNLAAVAVETPLREVVRCARCRLIQFQTVSQLCRRCCHSLAAGPRPDQEASLPKPTPIRGSAVLADQPVTDDGSGRSRWRSGEELAIGRRLRQVRQQQHLTQQMVATMVGVPRTYLSRIENGRLTPGPAMLIRIATAMSVDVVSLLLLEEIGGQYPRSAETLTEALLIRYFGRLQLKQMEEVLSHTRIMVTRKTDSSPARSLEGAAQSRACRALNWTAVSLPSSE